MAAISTADVSFSEASLRYQCGVPSRLYALTTPINQNQSRNTMPRRLFVTPLHWCGIQSQHYDRPSDVKIRMLGAALCCVACFAVRKLMHMHGAGVHTVYPALVAYPVTAVGFMSASAGAALLLLRSHVHDHVKVSARWSQLKPQLVSAEPIEVPVLAGDHNPPNCKLAARTLRCELNSYPYDLRELTSSAIVIVARGSGGGWPVQDSFGRVHQEFAVFDAALAFARQEQSRLPNAILALSCAPLRPSFFELAKRFSARRRSPR